MTTKVSSKVSSWQKVQQKIEITTILTSLEEIDQESTVEPFQQLFFVHHTRNTLLCYDPE